MFATPSLPHIYTGDEFCCQTVHHPVCSLYLVDTLLPYNHAFLERKVTHPFPPAPNNCGGGNEPTQKVVQGMRCEAVALDPLGAPSVSGCAATPTLAVAARLRFSRKGQDPGPCESVVSGGASRADSCVMAQRNLCAALRRCHVASVSAFGGD